MSRAQLLLRAPGVALGRGVGAGGRGGAGGQRGGLRRGALGLCGAGPAAELRGQRLRPARPQRGRRPARPSGAGGPRWAQTPGAAGGAGGAAFRSHHGGRHPVDLGLRRQLLVWRWGTGSRKEVRGEQPGDGHELCEPRG